MTTSDEIRAMLELLGSNGGSAEVHEINVSAHLVDGCVTVMRNGKQALHVSENCLQAAREAFPDVPWHYGYSPLSG